MKNCVQRANKLCEKRILCHKLGTRSFIRETEPKKKRERKEKRKKKKENSTRRAILINPWDLTYRRVQWIFLTIDVSHHP